MKYTKTGSDGVDNLSEGFINFHVYVCLPCVKNCQKFYLKLPALNEFLSVITVLERVYFLINGHNFGRFPDVLILLLSTVVKPL